MPATIETLLLKILDILRVIFIANDISLKEVKGKEMSSLF
jgi:hypothetical protein